MKIAIAKDTLAAEKRVAASPETVRKLESLGAEVFVVTEAGTAASITDDMYHAAGAQIVSEDEAYKDADVVLRVRHPSANELKKMKKGALMIGILSPYQEKDLIKAYAEQGITAMTMELVPRITRAQTMDVLSSQANLAGYRAMLEASVEFGRSIPLMMTAAGTVPAAKVFIMGVGVAGLQAIATARRLGAQVSATDVRPAVGEQVQSLGATFVMVESEETKTAETSDGYAKEMSDDYKKKQAALVAETIKKQDIIITTALIPGKKAPVLITDDMVKSMKTGSVIIDMAVEQGGNCALSKLGEVVDVNGVKIVGHLNMPSRIAMSSSALYARNLLSFLTPLIDKDAKELKIDWDDEIIKATMLTHDGNIVHPNFV